MSFRFRRTSRQALLQAEESVLNVSVSSVPKYQRSDALPPNQCTTINHKPLTIKSKSPVSLFSMSAPGALRDPDRGISRSRRSWTTSTPVVLPKGSSWLNVPFGHYSTAVLRSIDSVEVCQGRIT